MCKSWPTDLVIYISTRHWAGVRGVPRGCHWDAHLSTVGHPLLPHVGHSRRRQRGECSKPNMKYSIFTVSILLVPYNQMEEFHILFRCKFRLKYACWIVSTPPWDLVSPCSTVCAGRDCGHLYHGHVSQISALQDVRGVCHLYGLLHTWPAAMLRCK